MICANCEVDITSDTYKWGGHVYCHYCYMNDVSVMQSLQDELAIILVDVRKEREELSALAREYGLEDM